MANERANYNQLGSDCVEVINPPLEGIRGGVRKY